MHALRTLFALALPALALAGVYRRQSTSCGDSISCPADNGTIVIANTEAFIIECGIDHAGGDLPNQPIYPGGLGECIAACAATSGCVDFSLSGSACYLKGSVGPVVYDGVDGARLLGSGICQS